MVEEAVATIQVLVHEVRGGFWRSIKRYNREEDRARRIDLERWRPTDVSASSFLGLVRRYLSYYSVLPALQAHAPLFSRNKNESL